MIHEVHDSVKVAYKKLKQMVHFDKHPLTLRRRMAEFECTDGAYRRGRSRGMHCNLTRS